MIKIFDDAKINDGTNIKNIDKIDVYEFEAAIKIAFLELLDKGYVKIKSYNEKMN